MDGINHDTGEIITLPNQSQTIGKLAEALAKAQGKIRGAIKDSTNPHFRSDYADLASVWDACREALSANGLSVIQTLGAGVGGVTIFTTLAHSSGEWIRGSLTLKPVKDDPQGVGSAITYGRRYALAAMVGVAPADDDGEAASGRSEPKGAARKAAPKAEEEPPTWKANAEAIKAEIDRTETVEAVNAVITAEAKALKDIKEHSQTAYEFLIDRAEKRRGTLSQKAA